MQNERNGHVSRREMLRWGGALSAAGLAAGLPAGTLADTQTPPVPREGRADPNGRFAGRAVLITGATSGIGRATAEAFAREGASVFFCGRREELGAEVETGIRGFGGEATYLQADVREEEQVRAFVAGCVEAYGRVDIAFNNAGVESEAHPLHEMPSEIWHDRMATNASGVFYSMKHEIPVMLGQGGGIIVNNGSVSSLTGFATIAPYNASKHAVLSLTRVGAMEYSDQNIRIVGIAPGAVDTPMLQRAMEGFNMTAEQIAETFPIRRIVTVEEMARAVMWLASDEAPAVVGTIVDVTGGYLAG